MSQEIATLAPLTRNDGKKWNATNTVIHYFHPRDIAAHDSRIGKAQPFSVWVGDGFVVKSPKAQLLGKHITTVVADHSKQYDHHEIV